LNNRRSFPTAFARVFAAPDHKPPWARDRDGGDKAYLPASHSPEKRSAIFDGESERVVNTRYNSYLGIEQASTLACPTDPYSIVSHARIAFPLSPPPPTLAFTTALTFSSTPHLFIINIPHNPIAMANPAPYGARSTDALGRKQFSNIKSMITGAQSPKRPALADRITYDKESKKRSRRFGEPKEQRGAKKGTSLL
jgi:hypothetical protein